MTPSQYTTQMMEGFDEKCKPTVSFYTDNDEKLAEVTQLLLDRLWESSWKKQVKSFMLSFAESYSKIVLDKFKKENNL